MNEAIERAGCRYTGERKLCGALLRRLGVSGFLLLALMFGGCRKPVQEPVTITFLDPEWSHDLEVRRPLSAEALQEFTRETGVLVKHIPGPETAPDQLALTEGLLKKGAVTPDVYGIDVIWPGILSNYLIDLKPYLSSGFAEQDPVVLAGYTVGDRLVAIPYHPNIGIFYYRTDLLEKYGYSLPPRTWDEMEKMAAKIQAGERARGDKDFWGFVWPGADSEGLTCLGVEWQADEDGGHIIESDGKISVNNANATRTWERAARWVGSISPPSVTSYQEWDASNAFWITGRAAFFRGWMSDFFLTHPLAVPYRDKAGATSVPGGRVARVATLGGFGLGISKTSAHREEAVKLVKFLTDREARLNTERAQYEPPARPEAFELPTLLKAYARVYKPGENQGGGVVVRPSNIAGAKYDEVSEAYARAVHAVLTGKAKAPQAAADLEKELVRITGFATSRQH
jgi:trehalose/maltose transport system substrate-binding protein